MSRDVISKTVGDVFSEGFISVREGDSLSSCFQFFKEEIPPVLTVVDVERRYKGVLARRWVVRSMLDPATTKVETLMCPTPKVAPDDSLGKVARLMVEGGLGQLPVFSGETLLGFVTDENILHVAVVEKWGNTKIDVIMTNDPFVVKEDDSISAVISLFRDQDVSHVPVVSNGKLVGIISIRDIIESVFKPRQRQTLGERVGEKIPVLGVSVKHIMTKPVITILPTSNLRYAAEKMHEFDVSSLVVARRRRPIGIVTKLDFLETIIQMERIERKLTLQFSVKDDVELDDIQRGIIIADFDSFARRCAETLEAGILFIYMKTYGSNYGRQLIHYRLQLRTRTVSFFSSSEGWNVEETFRIALDRLDRQITASKDLENKPQYYDMYL